MAIFPPDSVHSVESERGFLPIWKIIHALVEKVLYSARGMGLLLLN